MLALAQDRDVIGLLLEQLDLQEARAPLYAAVGAFGIWEHRRKVVLAHYKLEVRTEAEQQRPPVKLTVDLADDLGRTQPGYTAQLDVAERDRTALELLDAQLLFVAGLLAKLKAEEYAKH
jgi:hypothetical protein